MLLQRALRELDGEIDRLARIRAIVATLQTRSSIAGPPPPTPSEPEAEAFQPMVPAASIVAAEQPADAPPLLSSATPRKSRRLRLERTTRTHRPPPPVARALGGTIPAQPVFIAAKANGSSGSSEAVARTPVAPPVAQEGTLDALLRELSYRPSPRA